MKSTIEKIHAEFDTAQDRLLLQAKEILSKTKKLPVTPTESIGDRLKKVGFINAPVVKASDNIKKVREQVAEMLVKTESEAELIEEYRNTYPFLKFLTEAELDRICTKYSLVYAPIANYIKDVPEKNLRDIENAQALKEKHVRETIYRFSKNVHGGSEKEFLQLLGKTEALFTQNELRNLIIKAQGYDWPQWYDLENGADVSVAWFVISRSMMSNTVSWKMYERTNKAGLFIAAPQSHFDTKGLTKKGLGFFEVFKTEVKDPIVFRYVKGGIQVITKWGLEAEDPALVVPVLN